MSRLFVVILKCFKLLDMSYLPYPKVAERKVDHCRYFNRRLPDEDITSPLQGPGEETL